MTTFAWGAHSDTGRVRTGNEDFVLAAGTLFAVADGMGGHSGGEIASHLAIESVMRIYDDGGRHTTDGLVEAVQLANSALVQRAEREPDLKGMGTTICALALVDGADEPLIGVINVGDSRLYLLKREGELEQITEDHSLVATLERQGRISKAEAAVHPQRNIITRALGIDAEVMVDSWEIVPFVGDRFLICSDGLYNEVDDSKVAAVLRRLADPAEAAHELVRLANESGGRDNISVVVVDIVDDDHRPHPDDLRVARVMHGSERVLHAAIAPPPGAVLLAQRSPDTGSDPDEDPVDPGGAAGGPRGAGADGHRGSAKPVDPIEAIVAEAVAVEPAPERRRIFTWRLVAFFVALVLLVGVAVTAIVYVGTSTYYVGVQDEKVAIFRGRPGGLLWIDPAFQEDAGILITDVPPDQLPEIRSGKEQSTLDDAHSYVDNLGQRIRELTPTTSTTTTSTPTTTTSASVTTPPTDPASTGGADAGAAGSPDAGLLPGDP